MWGKPKIITLGIAPLGIISIGTVPMGVHAMGSLGMPCSEHPSSADGFNTYGSANDHRRPLRHGGQRQPVEIQVAPEDKEMPGILRGSSVMPPPPVDTGGQGGCNDLLEPMQLPKASSFTGFV